ncbi:MAG: hypothetical protein WKF59_13115 [Chitinophagaceae bacterium]
MPRNPIQVTNAFSNEANDRQFQDVGFDGLNDSAEIDKRRTDYLELLSNKFWHGNSKIYLGCIYTILLADNYRYYQGADLDAQNVGILGRYKGFNNPQGNSPLADNSSEFSSAATLYPDQEDLNRDNTLNETEEYFQYIVDLKPASSPQMNIGQNYIVDKKPVSVKLARWLFTY